MADLRNLLTQLGFGDVQSLLQSGNLVFRANTRTAAQLERLLEAEAEKRLGLQTDFFVRTAKEWDGVVSLTNAVIDKQLGTRGTGRNWNTVLKLGALAAG